MFRIVLKLEQQMWITSLVSDSIYFVSHFIYTLYIISQQKTKTSNSELTMFSGIYISAEDGDKGGEMARQWEASIRQALMPVVHVTGPQGSVSSTKVS